MLDDDLENISYLEPAQEGYFGEWKEWNGAQETDQLVKGVKSKFDNSYWGD